MEVLEAVEATNVKTLLKLFSLLTKKDTLLKSKDKAETSEKQTVHAEN